MDMMSLDKTSIARALRLLALLLERADAAPVHLVVCGGASLIVTGLGPRTTTRDVDVLGIRAGDGVIHRADPLPEPLAAAARRVAADLGFDEHWLNAGPTAVLDFGLPAGLAERLQQVTFGARLCVSFISRLDQIHFKVFAAADQGPGRHVADLQALHPTAEEIEAAARWAMTHDPSAGFRSVLRDMLRKLGYGDVADKI
jgi:hypothetical protein